MLSNWIFAAVVVTILFFGIPLAFLSMALFTRIRNAWTAKMLWRSIRCPVQNKDAQVGFLEKTDSFRNLKTLDAVYCTALGDPTEVTCGKECMSDQVR